MSLTRASAAVIKTEEIVNNRNRIINGDMRIDQRNVGASVTLNATAPYVTDRWKCNENTDGTATCQQVSDAPTGFNYSLKYTTTSTDTDLTGLQSTWVAQQIEGYTIADLSWGTASAKTITVSFWVKSSLTGTFSVGVYNDDFNRTYVTTYTINSADTWEYKTLTIPGETSGTWNTTNGLGIGIGWFLGVGPSLSTSTINTWQSVGRQSATGSVSVIGTLNATWYITGVQLEVGSVATPFERRPYGTELSLCQRYFEKTFAIGVVPAVGGNLTSLADPGNAAILFAGHRASQINSGYPPSGFRWKVVKRATPSVSFYGNSSGHVPCRTPTSGISWYTGSSWGLIGTTDSVYVSNEFDNVVYLEVYAHFTGSAEL